MNLYQTISGELRQAITGKLLKPGDRILSIKEMKEKYGVSHITVLRVYKELAAEKLIECRHGQGYFVCAPAARQRPVFGRFACFVRAMRPPRLTDNYFNEINMGIQMEAASRRIDLLLSHRTALLDAYIPTAEIQNELKNAMLAAAENTDGFLLDERISDEVIADVIEKTRKPMVLLNRHTDLPVNIVRPDNESGLRMLLDMGRKMKYSQFVFCAQATLGESYNPVSNYNAMIRDAAFRELVPDSEGEVVNDCLQVPLEVFLRRISTVYQRRRKNGRVLLICTSDTLAEELCPYFCPQGTAPDDLGIAGMDGLDCSRLCRPKLVTMKTDTLDMGRKAVELLQDSINGTDSYAPAVFLAPMVFTPGGTMN